MLTEASIPSLNDVQYVFGTFSLKHHHKTPQLCILNISFISSPVPDIFSVTFTM